LIEVLYVSRAALAQGDERAQLDRILEVARVRNLALGVTGALLYMHGRFAQLLEGSSEAVNQLMVAILRDIRHADVRIVRMNETSDRRFATWSMAEIAPDLHVGTLLETLGAEHPPADAADALIRFMAERAGSARLGRP
jgi:hypothetical protein